MLGPVMARKWPHIVLYLFMKNKGHSEIKPSVEKLVLSLALPPISSFSQLSILISAFMIKTSFLTHSFTQQTFVEGLLYAWPGSTC